MPNPGKPDSASPLDSRGQVVCLLACMGVTFVLGSVHAFSVLLVPLEILLDESRSGISLVYSLALLSITVSVLYGYRCYAALSPALLVTATCLTAATGLVISASATGLPVLIMGYSLLFGAANGMGYGFTLQLAGRVMPLRSGLAMSCVTAAYAVGSVVFSLVLAGLLDRYSVSGALLGLSVVILTVGTLCAVILASSGASYSHAVEAAWARKVDASTVFGFRTCYFLAVFSGLMVIGHAAGIVEQSAGPGSGVRGAMAVGVGSAAGGFCVALLLDKWGYRPFLWGLPLLAAAALSVLMVSSDALTPLLAISVVGFSYGGLIAVYPYAINEVCGVHAGPAVYGKVFIAWGVSGLLAPWFAGITYDWQGSYTLALAIAAFAALGSAVAVKFARL